MLGVMPGRFGTPMSWQRPCVYLGHLSGHPEQGQKHCWLASGLWFLAAAVAGWVSHIPLLCLHLPSQWDKCLKGLVRNALRPQAGWCSLECRVGSSAALCSQCCNQFVSAAVDREKGNCPLNVLTSPWELRGCEGDLTAWECHTWHLSRPWQCAPLVTLRGFCLVAPAGCHSSLAAAGCLG